jgi:hypothetical protein
MGKSSPEATVCAANPRADTWVRRYNPVKHGQVTRVAEWAYSSFYRYVERGIYNLEWAADDKVRSLEME